MTKIKPQALHEARVEQREKNVHVLKNWHPLFGVPMIPQLSENVLLRVLYNDDTRETLYANDVVWSRVKAFYIPNNLGATEREADAVIDAALARMLSKHAAEPPEASNAYNDLVKAMKEPPEYSNAHKDIVKAMKDGSLVSPVPEMQFDLKTDMQSSVTNERKHSHYFKDVSHLDAIDVYRVIELFEVNDPCLQHALKKILCSGKRGFKEQGKDVQEAIDSLTRWQEMRAEDEAAR